MSRHLVYKPLMIHFYNFQDVYSKIFARSRLQIQSGIGMAPPQNETVQHQNSDGTTITSMLEPVNIFLLPDVAEEGK